MMGYFDGKPPDLEKLNALACFLTKHNLLSQGILLMIVASVHKRNMDLCFGDFLTIIARFENVQVNKYCLLEEDPVYHLPDVPPDWLIQFSQALDTFGKERPGACPERVLTACRSLCDRLLEERAELRRDSVTYEDAEQHAEPARSVPIGSS